MERKRILQVNIDNNGGNGAFSLIRNFYEYLKNEYIFDYFTMGEFLQDSVLSEIEMDGGKCYSAKLRKNKVIGHLILPFRFYSFLTKNNYEVVHIHSEVAYKQFLYAVASRWAKIPRIVIHSHSSNIDGNCRSLKYYLHKFFLKKVNRIGDVFVACSQPAADWMFVDGIIHDKPHMLIRNGISPEKYAFSQEKRLILRRKYAIEDKKVIIHVGSLKKVKNQQFLIDMISNLKKDNYILWLIGDGEDRNQLIKKCKDLDCLDVVVFWGNRVDVADLLQAADIFVFPSLFEGIPLSLIEAQAAGLPIIASDEIDHDIKVNDNVIFVPLFEDTGVWCEYVKDHLSNHIRRKGYINICESMYNIKKSADALRAIYNINA